MLTDGYNRTIDYLRISLTDKCNLRCKYCVPSCGVERKDHSEILTLEEVLRITDIMTRLGVRKVRFTGGEPLLRKNAVGLIKNVSKLTNAPKICITTNGVLLGDYLDFLYDASVRDINISLDTLDPATYEAITGEDALESVFGSIRECLMKDIDLKINAVPIKGINDDDIPSLASIAKDNPITVRFIELMPLGCASAYQGVPNDEVRRKLFEVYGEEKEVINDVNSPAHYVTYEGFTGKIGFISPVSHAFCKNCNRLRLTCDGKLKLCLASPLSLDLKALIRSGASDKDISQAITEAVLKKPEHHGFGAEGYTAGPDNMIGIGG